LNRNIDKAIAEHLFHQVVVVDDEGYNTTFLPFYSSSYSKIPSIINKLKTMNNCCFKMSLDIPGDVWRVEIKGGHKYACKPKAVIDGIESLPTAVCLAALKSIGYDIKDLIKEIKE